MGLVDFNPAQTAKSRILHSWWVLPSRMNHSVCVYKTMVKVNEFAYRFVSGSTEWTLRWKLHLLCEFSGDPTWARCCSHCSDWTSGGRKFLASRSCRSWKLTSYWRWEFWWYISSDVWYLKWQVYLVVRIISPTLIVRPCPVKYFSTPNWCCEW